MNTIAEVNNNVADLITRQEGIREALRRCFQDGDIVTVKADDTKTEYSIQATPPNEAELHAVADFSNVRFVRYALLVLVTR